jgi:CRISPR/Cas system-associated endoribonuclease Cas2
LRQNHTRFQNSKNTCPLEEFSLLFYHLWPTQRLQKSFFVLSAPSENAKCWTD